MSRFRFGARLLLVACLATSLGQTPASAQRDLDLKDIPDPDPEVERASFTVAEGFEVNLFAADPQIAKPIQINFDQHGRLWIASSELYPHIKPGQQANDKILVVEDVDGDGTADTTTVFADGLLIPTGVAPGDDGVYVANSTELLHLQDTDGDGQADRRRVVLSGFGTEDTHHLLHTLRWGPDGALYMNQSIYIHSHVETPYGVQRLDGGGIWRFRPETMQLEVLCKGFVNPWGHHFDAWGQSFVTDGAYREGVNHVFPGSVFFSSPGATRILRGMTPGSPKHCGLEVLSGRHLPESWRGNMLTNDFRAHRVCRFVISEDRSSYAARQQQELITSSHVAFRPVDVKMGPDGAIYIADWYNPIIQHGEVDFRDPRRDQVHGRIWRVTAKDRPLLQRPNFASAEVPELLDLLKVPEQWNRLHAKLQLKQRDPRKVLPELDRWLEQLDADDPEYQHHRLEAIWLLQGMRQVREPLLAELLAADDHRVRAAAMRVVSEQHARLQHVDDYLRQGIRDPHPRVQLETARVLAQLPNMTAVNEVLRVVEQPRDEFLDFAVWQAVRDLQSVWLPELLEHEWNPAEPQLLYALEAAQSAAGLPPLLARLREGRISSTGIEQALALIASLGGPSELGQLLQVVYDTEQLEPQQRAILLDAIVAAGRARKQRPQGSLEPVLDLLAAEERPLQLAAARAAAAWELHEVRETLVRWLADRDNVDRQQVAIDALASLGGDASVRQLIEIASDSANEPLRLRAVQGLSVLAPKAAADQAAQWLSQLTADRDPAAGVVGLLERRGGPEALTAALVNQPIQTDVAKRLLRIIQQSSQPSEQLLAAVRTAGGLAEQPWKLTAQLQQELVEEVLAKGDPQRGEQVYRRDDLQCLKCHAIGGAGGLVGPDLISIGASAPVDYLVESLLAPNAKIKENFHSLTVQDENGNVYTGIAVQQTDQQLVLRDAEDRLVSIPTAAIEQQVEGRSLMPDGLLDGLTRDELVDLTRFLAELGKVGDFQVGSARLVRRWQTMVWTQEANHRLNRTSFDLAATDDLAWTWAPQYSRVSGDLPIEQLPRFQPHQEVDPTSFLRLEIDVTTAGAVALQFNDPTGLTVWIAGQPTGLVNPLTFELVEGRQTITVAVNQLQRSVPLRVELVDVESSAAQAQIVLGK